MFVTTFFHRITADIKVGDIIIPMGRKPAYVTESIDTARVFATKQGRVYEVESV